MRPRDRYGLVTLFLVTASQKNFPHGILKTNGLIKALHFSGMVDGVVIMRTAACANCRMR